MGLRRVVSWELLEKEELGNSTVADGLWIVFLNELIVSRVEVAVVSDVLCASLLGKQLTRRSKIGVILCFETFFIVGLIQCKELAFVIWCSFEWASDFFVESCSC